jgi:hypothetical protein
MQSQSVHAICHIICACGICFSPGNCVVFGGNIGIKFPKMLNEEDLHLLSGVNFTLGGEFHYAKPEDYSISEVNAHSISEVNAHSISEVNAHSISEVNANNRDPPAVESP